MDGTQLEHPATIIRVDASELRDAARWAKGPISRRVTVPILGAIAISVDRVEPDGTAQIVLRGTDLDVEATATIEGEATLSGKPAPFCAAIGAAGLVAFAETAPAGAAVSITLEETPGGRRITLATEGPQPVRVKLNAILDAADFPTPMTAGLLCVLAAPVGEARLFDALGIAIAAASTEETRYYLNGAFLHRAQLREMSGLCLVATDGHKLTAVALGVDPDGVADAWRGVIIPRAALLLARRLTRKGGNGEARLRVYETQDGGPARVAFVGGRFRLVARVIDGAFPDYTRVVPPLEGGEATRLTLSAPQIDRLVKVAGGFKGSGDFWPALVFDGAAQRLSLTAHIDGMPEVSAPCAGRGEKLAINPKYLRDMLRALGAAELLQAGEGEPVRLRCEDPGRLGVIMPMRV